MQPCFTTGLIFLGLMGHAEQVEESRPRKRNTETKKVKSFKGSSSMSRIDFQDKPMFKKSFRSHVPSNFSIYCNDRGYSPNNQEEKNVDPQKQRPTCGKCGNKHVGECLVLTNCNNPKNGYAK